MYRRMRALARRRCKHGETSIDPTHDCEEEEKPMPYQVEPAPGESAQCSGPRGRHPIRIPARALHPGQSESTAQHKGRIDTCNLYLRAGVNLLLANWVESIDTLFTFTSTNFETPTPSSSTCLSAPRTGCGSSAYHPWLSHRTPRRRLSPAANISGVPNRGNTNKDFPSCC